MKPKAKGCSVQEGANVVWDVEDGKAKLNTFKVDVYDEGGAAIPKTIHVALVTDTYARRSMKLPCLSFKHTMVGLIFISGFV